jgi:hypothetical protein
MKVEGVDFTFLPQIAFEDEETKADIQARGLLVLDPMASSYGAQFREKIAASYLPKSSVRFLGDQIGHGLFTEESISEGDYVGEYTGIVRRDDMRKYLEPINNYCFKYPVLDSLGKDHVIDATQGHLTRFINHSPTPNLKPIYALFDGFYHLIFLANQPISKGSQLTYDYGYNYWCVRKPPQVISCSIV